MLLTQACQLQGQSSLNTVRTVSGGFPGCQACFDRISCVVSLLQYSSKPFEVVCDALLIGIGAEMLQEGRPVASDRKKPLSAKRSCTTDEQELFAVVHAVRASSGMVTGHRDQKVYSSYVPSVPSLPYAGLSRSSQGVQFQDIWPLLHR